MSNHLAFATVTYVLQQRLNQVVGADVSGATATAIRPDGTDGQLPAPGVNVFLMQATPSGEMGNLDLPTRTTAGTMSGRPTSAYELVYLLTFHGLETRLEPQRVQASVLRYLHAEPCLSKATIRAQILAALAGDANHFLKGSNLADQASTVKLTPYRLNLDELSKLWSVFFQTNYVLSSAIKATFVLLDSEDAGQEALPVRIRATYAIPFPDMAIDRIVPDKVPFTPTAEVTLQGHGLRGDQKRVLVDGLEAAIQPGGTGDAVTVRLPAGLRAGVKLVKVVDQNPLGPAHLGTESNLAAFQLLPAVQTITYHADPSVKKDHTIEVAPAPVVAIGQKAELLLNRTTAPAAGKPASYALSARPRSGDADPLIFAAREVANGVYLYRLRVDGVDSLLTIDASNPDPAQQPYDGPTVTIP